jgi:transcriptional regulator of acetoin/glycerol metabolism
MATLLAASFPEPERSAVVCIATLTAVCIDEGGDLADRMRMLKTSILRAADSNSTVLIACESGTGKELIARSIHELRALQRDPILAINAAGNREK